MHFVNFKNVALLLFAWFSSQVASEPVGIKAWHVDCEHAKSQCIVKQRVETVQSGQTVLGVMVGYIDKHPAPHIIFRTSPRANRQKGAAIKIDQHAMLRVPSLNCNDRVCEVRSFIPKGLLKQMLTGEKMHFAFFIENKQYTYPVSLDGFSKAYAKIYPATRAG